MNQNAVFAPFLPSPSGYQYSTAIEQLCAQCAAVIDGIYADMRSSKSALSKISDSQKGNLLALIGNLEEAAGFFFPVFTCAGWMPGYVGTLQFRRRRGDIKYLE